MPAPTPRDAAALALLTPRQRQVMELLARGHDATEIGRRLKLDRTAVNAAVYQARRRIAAGVPRRPYGKAGSGICNAGHARRTGRPCQGCQRERRRARALLAAKEEKRLDASAGDRIQRDIAAGKRCPRCWLLSPCADHEGRRAGR